MSDDTELLDFAEQFCKRRGGGDRFATLGLSLDSGSELDQPPISFREALRNLRSGDTQANRDACAARMLALFWTDGVTGDQARTIAVVEFGQQTVDEASAYIREWSNP